MPPLLLDHVRSLVEAERALIDAIETTTPLLQQNTMSSSILSSQSDPPLLPTPRNIEEVKTILAVARTYSLRTSAPPMWNPNLPVIGFATPNPLPHQLRGGALGAMQLKMAREEKNRKIKEAADNLREKERKDQKDQMEVEEDEHEATAKKESEDAMDIDEATKEGEAKAATPAEGKVVDPKKQEMIVNQKRRMEQVAANGQKKQTSAEMHAKKAAANMNLSDSSSSEEDEGSDSD
mmetsp:Transcript_23018/g.46074  ORF Transcript_23018/g.46074 Transcript_23018/m.46074 type:complete len:236 (-) Transcript_23018:134-841(-)